MSRVLYDFPGGLKLPTGKGLSDHQPSLLHPLPERLYLPLHQHVGHPAAPCVKVGDKVRKGQLIAESREYVSVPVHASTSGRILDIGDYPVPHPAEFKAPCIVIEADGLDEWHDIEPVPDYAATDPIELQRVIHNRGVVGLGGAGFPTHVKLGEGFENAVELLIINGVECEPYITCDDRLIQEKAAYIIAGARMIGHAVRARQCVIAIEDDMPEARQALAAALDGDDIELITVPTRYPAGGEKQLIRTLTGRDVPIGGLPIDIGIVIQNVATAAAVYRAVTRGEPLISRYVTITGAIENPRNLQVLLGTPVRDCVEKCGHRSFSESRIVLGGPMMGMQVNHPNIPIVKTTNCVLIQQRESLPPELPCIRCGRCQEVCPASLLPQQLYHAALMDDFELASDRHLFECIECGLCAYVCPSRIPLVRYFRYAKTQINNQERQLQTAHELRERFLTKRQREREDTRQSAPDIPALDETQEDKRAYIKEAINRSRSRREQIRRPRKHDEGQGDD